MALQLDKTLDTGVTGNYWKIGNIIRDTYRNTTRFDLELYVNKDAKDTGKLPLESNYYTVDSIDWINSENNILTDCYTYVKAQPEFSGALDV